MTTTESQISTLLNAYLHSFNTSSYTEASTYYHEPAIAISATGTILLPTRPGIATFLSNTVTRLQQDSFDHSEWIGFKKIIILEDDGEKGLVLASCGCKRVRKDGSSCEEFTATYTLRRVEGSWLIVSIHQHPLSTRLT